jgi:hypothetical protein
MADNSILSVKLHTSRFVMVAATAVYNVYPGIEYYMSNVVKCVFEPRYNDDLKLHKSSRLVVFHKFSSASGRS